VHHTEVIMLRSLVLRTFPDAKMLTWRSGRAAAAGVAAVLPDEVLNEAYTDYLGGHDFLCTQYKFTAAAANAVQKRMAIKHINAALQKALLVAIKKKVKLKHLSHIPQGCRKRAEIQCDISGGI